MVKFLQDRNKDFPPGTPPAQIDGFRLVRREAIAALAQGRFPTLADKSRPAWVLLKIVADDGITAEPRLDERVEAAIGVATPDPIWTKTINPITRRASWACLWRITRLITLRETRILADASVPWRWTPAGSIEALEQMKAQTKNVYVGKVVDETEKLLTNIEKGSPRRYRSISNKPYASLRRAKSFTRATPPRSSSRPSGKTPRRRKSRRKARPSKASIRKPLRQLPSGGAFFFSFLPDP